MPKNGQGILQRALRVETRRTEVARVIAANPEVTESQLCEIVGVGKGTLHRDKKAILTDTREERHRESSEARERILDRMEAVFQIGLRRLEKEVFSAEGESMGVVIDPGAVALVMKSQDMTAKIHGLYVGGKDGSAPGAVMFGDGPMSEAIRAKIEAARLAVMPAGDDGDEWEEDE